MQVHGCCVDRACRPIAQIRSTVTHAQSHALTPSCHVTEVDHACRLTKYSPCSDLQQDVSRKHEGVPPVLGASGGCHANLAATFVMLREL